MTDPAPGSHRHWHHLPAANIFIFKSPVLDATFMMKKSLLWEEQLAMGLHSGEKRDPELLFITWHKFHELIFHSSDLKRKTAKPF
jgi:hypothetical protein